MAGRGFLTALSVVIVGLTAFALGFWLKGSNTVVSPTPTPSQNVKATPTVISSPTPIASTNILVTSPRANDTVSSSFLIEGQARVFENVLNYKLIDLNNKVLAKGNITANALDTGEFGPFVNTIHFSTTAKSGTLQVYSLSPKDGSEINVVKIPLNFK